MQVLRCEKETNIVCVRVGTCVLCSSVRLNGPLFSPTASGCRFVTHACSNGRSHAGRKAKRSAFEVEISHHTSRIVNNATALLLFLRREMTNASGKSEKYSLSI